MSERRTIGVVGYGFVGEAVAKGLAPVADVIVYDKAKGWLEIRDGVVPMRDTGSAIVEDIRYCGCPDEKIMWAEHLVASCSIIFVCVPTPMKKDGSCSTEIVEEVVRGLNEAWQDREVGGPEDKITVVIKSTVPPGTTARLQEECCWLDLVFNPEFLTEANYLEDFAGMERVVIGGSGRGLEMVVELYEDFCEGEVYGEGSSTDYQPLRFLTCSSTEAELIKYVTNCFLATKVSLANEFAQVCEKVGADWDTVWGIASTDERLGTSHWRVPGPDGKQGFGGSCFPKDMAGMIHFMIKNGVPPHVLQGAWWGNIGVRPERDWEQLKGRAVE